MQSDGRRFRKMLHREGRIAGSGGIDTRTRISNPFSGVEGCQKDFEYPVSLISVVEHGGYIAELRRLTEAGNAEVTCSMDKSVACGKDLWCALESSVTRRVVGNEGNKRYKKYADKGSNSGREWQEIVINSRRNLRIAYLAKTPVLAANNIWIHAKCWKHLKCLEQGGTHKLVNHRI